MSTQEGMEMMKMQEEIVKSHMAMLSLAADRVKEVGFPDQPEGSQFICMVTDELIEEVNKMKPVLLKQVELAKEFVKTFEEMDKISEEKTRLARKLVTQYISEEKYDENIGALPCKLKGGKIGLCLLRKS